MSMLKVGPALAAVIVLSVVAGVLGAGSPARAAQTAVSCADATAAGATGPAVVSAASTAYGKVLVEGAGDHAGCSLYALSSDALRALSSGADPFACSDNLNALGAECDTILWPALLTSGRPIAGPGVNPALLGTVTRDDLSIGGVGLGTVQQVTYAGLPLYRFLFDDGPGDTQGANLFDPVTSPTGIWYLIDPSRGLPATGRARLQTETAPANGGADETVLSVTMDTGFTDLFANASFPVYTLSSDSHTGSPKSACLGECAAGDWMPVLTSGQPAAGAGVDQHALGTIVRPDGSHQVTYDNKPLYLYAGDAYIGGLPYGAARIDGDGRSGPAGGTFNAVPLP